MGLMRKVHFVIRILSFYTTYMPGLPDYISLPCVASWVLLAKRSISQSVAFIEKHSKRSQWKGNGTITLQCNYQCPEQRDIVVQL